MEVCHLVVCLLCKHENLTDSVFLSCYFSVSMVKHHDDLSSLHKEEFIWAYCSRGIRIDHVRVMASIAAGTEDEISTFKCKHKAEQAGHGQSLKSLKTCLRWHTSISRPPLQNTSKLHHLLGIKSSSTGAYGNLSHSNHHRSTEFTQKTGFGLVRWLSA